MPTQEEGGTYEGQARNRSQVSESNQVKEMSSMQVLCHSSCVVLVPPILFPAHKQYTVYVDDLTRRNQEL